MTQHAMTEFTGGQRPRQNHYSLRAPHCCVSHVGFEPIKFINEDLRQCLQQIYAKIQCQKGKIVVQVLRENEDK